MVSLRNVVALATSISLVSAHTVITYPGWRGDNLNTSGEVNKDDYRPDLFPYGMQWMYPCGGLKIADNRTYWPVQGGALSFQPGWFQGHLTALIYVNIGLPDFFSEDLGYKIPQNYSHNIIKPFQITGPTNFAYPNEEVCIPNVPLDSIPGIDWHDGMNVTLQVVEAAQHGAALYSCVDLTLTTNLSLVAEVNSTNCINSPEISQQYQVFTTSMTGSATRQGIAGTLGALTLAAGLWSLM